VVRRYDASMNTPTPAIPVAVPDDRYDYFEHDADIGVIGRGDTLEESFEAAAAATFAIMIDLTEVRCVRTERFTFEEADTELALVRWLNQLLGMARERAIAFAEFRLERDGVVWRGMATGEPWRAGIERGVEVKGATLTMLKVEHTGAGWEARCVVDV
jgi:SHS2 domain-containing protein